MKLCRDCRFYRGKHSTNECASPKNIEDYAPDYINGEETIQKPIWLTALNCRKFKDACGPDAKWFELKEAGQVKDKSQGD